jgi:hypothetical protein
MKFSSILNEPRKRKTITLPLPGAQQTDDGTWEGPTVKVDVRALTGIEPDTVHTLAVDYAKKRSGGGELDQDLVESGRIIHTLILACIDTDSPPESPQPFFDTGVEGIENSNVLLPELKQYLYEQQQLHQDETNPLVGTQTPEQFAAAVVATAQGDMSFFVCMRPGMLWSFTHSMASLLMPLMLQGSQPSSPSEPQERTETA